MPQPGAPSPETKLLPNGIIQSILNIMATQLLSPRLTSIDSTARAFAPTPISDDEAAAMFRAVRALFGHWNVPDDTAAILLDLPLRSYRRWKAGEIGRIDRDQRARLSNLMGVHKALRILFREPQRGYEWVSRPNAAFGGASALEVMRGGELTDIMRVRRYLDAERGAW
jgi:hypothetical protein